MKTTGTELQDFVTTAYPNGVPAEKHASVAAYYRAICQEVLYTADGSQVFVYDDDSAAVLPNPLRAA